MWTCFHCGHNSVYWDSDCTGEEAGYYVDGVVTFFTCANCGAEFEMFVMSDEEREREELEKTQAK